MGQGIEVVATAGQSVAALRTTAALHGEQEMTYEACVALAASVGLSASGLVALAK